MAEGEGPRRVREVGRRIADTMKIEPLMREINLQRMAAASGHRGQVPEVLANHPSDERRITHFREWVPRVLGSKRAYDEGRVAPVR